MKRWHKLIPAALALLLLAGCGAAQPQMTLQRAKLSEKETEILRLAGAHNSVHIFDYAVDDTAQAIQFNTYRLNETGYWEMVSGGGGLRLEDKKGRFAVGFEKIAAGVYTAVAGDGTQYSASRYTTEPPKELDGDAVMTSYISDAAHPVVYEQEIVLALQAFEPADTTPRPEPAPQAEGEQMAAPQGEGPRSYAL